MAILLQLFTIIAPVFACAALGYVWHKMRRPFDNETVTSLITNVGTPCLVFDTLVRLELDMGVFIDLGLAAAATVVGFGLLGWLYLRVTRAGLPDFLPALMFPNCGNMGVPLCLFAFGEIGLGMGIAFFAVMVLFQFTIGIAIAAGDISLRFILRTPMVYAVFAAVGLLMFDLRLPEWLSNTVHLFAGLTIPVMLMALGVSLAALGISKLRDSLSIALSRILIGLLVGPLVVMMLGLEGAAAGVVIIMAAMPVAVFSYLFGLRYGRSPDVLA
ncbi:MAG: AEC family transporter, partial [Pseudomonadota bacterium]|nr:AEC family transporter [Pseudomonadota bacterium]